MSESEANFESGAADSAREELVATEQLLAKAIGGWRGMLDSGLPTAVFLLVFTAGGNDIRNSAIAAVAVAAAIAAVRAFQRRSLQQVASGLMGVIVSAYFAARTGKAEDYFIPSLLTNLAYGLAIALSALLRYPLLGFVIGGLQGDLVAWRSDLEKLRLYTRLSWLWVGVFALRLVVKTPLYLLGNVQLLGTVHLIMSWPLYLAAVYVTYRAVRVSQSGSK